MLQTQFSRPSADALNTHLSGGGSVQVTTYLRSTIYTAKHAGMFFERGDNLYVKRGRYADCLSTGNRLLVSVRLSK